MIRKPFRQCRDCGRYTASLTGKGSAVRKELEAMLPPGAIIAGPKGWLSIPYDRQRPAAAAAAIKQAAKAGLPLKKGCQGCAEVQSLKFCRVDGGQNAASSLATLCSAAYR